MSRKKSIPAAPGTLTTFRVLVTCRSDETGQAYAPGDTLTGDDFPQEVLANWLEIGVIERTAPEEGETDG
ncbi:MAG: hypothetical protein IT318_23800 [Anaerolineales bacterium]|nr:hypothetical protein [Anaerolineales bacterium]